MDTAPYPCDELSDSWVFAREMGVTVPPDGTLLHLTNCQIHGSGWIH